MGRELPQVQKNGDAMINDAGKQRVNEAAGSVSLSKGEFDHCPRRFRYLSLKGRGRGVQRAGRGSNDAGCALDVVDPHCNPPPYPKSDISDFGTEKILNSGRPDFSGRESRRGIRAIEQIQ